MYTYANILIVDYKVDFFMNLRTYRIEQYLKQVLSMYLNLLFHPFFVKKKGVRHI